MKIIMITGGAGAGKTHLLQTIKAIGNVFLIDPLAVDVISTKTWRKPPADTVIVAFDHLSKLKNASAQVIDAIMWCDENDVALCLCDQKRADIEALAIEIDGTAAELNLDSAYTLKVNGKCTELGDQMLAACCLIDLARQVVTA
jgi:predicted ATP-binding protein involved in virulence